MSSPQEMRRPTPEGLTPAKEKLCLQLFDIGAIKFGNFRLKLHEENPRAPLSPVYIDLRILQRFPEEKKTAVDVYRKLVFPLQFDLLAGIPIAATPITSSLSDRLGIGMITPRVDAKTHGTGAKVDGMTSRDKGKRVLVVDDLITGADSKLLAIKILEEEGLKAGDVVVLIDRQQGGREALEARRYRLHSAFTLNQMLNFYLRVGKISKEVYDDTKIKLEELSVLMKS